MAFTKELGLIAAGFVLGTVGVKMVTSEQAKKLCVQAVSKGLQVKAAGQDIIEQAKSNVDDIIAEANYLNQQEEATVQAAAGAAPAAAAAPAAPAAPAATASTAPPAKRGRQKK